MMKRNPIAGSTYARLNTKKGFSVVVLFLVLQLFGRIAFLEIFPQPLVIPLLLLYMINNSSGDGKKTIVAPMEGEEKAVAMPTAGGSNLISKLKIPLEYRKLR